jgi:hypothetical protein
MSHVPITGLDGTEPIGFMAGLGVLRLIDRVTTGARLGWIESGGGWHPFYQTANCECLPETLAEQASECLRTLSQNGEFGIAHFGEKISVDRSVFRIHADYAVSSLQKEDFDAPLSRDDGWMTTAMLSSFASDGLLEKNGTVSATAISFSNGASGQLLLKDFLTAARLCSPDRLKATFCGKPILESITSLNWDPKDQRAAAHRWQDPATEKQDVDPAVNALAFIGLSYFTAVPGKRLQSLGWSKDRPRGLCWPLWDYSLSSDCVATCIAHSLNMRDPESLGVREIRFSRVTNPDGKRNYFAPSRVRK